MVGQAIQSYTIFILIVATPSSSRFESILFDLVLDRVALVVGFFNQGTVNKFMNNARKIRLIWQSLPDSPSLQLHEISLRDSYVDAFVFSQCVFRISYELFLFARFATGTHFIRQLSMARGSRASELL